MASLTITNNDLGSVVFKEGQFRDEILALAAADTILEGTILARREVSSTIANGVADVGNTGDGTLTACALYGNTVIPKIGGYLVTCTTAVTNGGIFSLTDPNGVVVEEGITITAGAGGTALYKGLTTGLEFTITDGATDFAEDDFFTVTVVADGDMVPFALAGVGGAQFAIAVLTYEVVVLASGDVAIRAMVDGSVRKERLVIDGTAAGVGITDAIIDQLRDFSIISIDVNELNIADNQ